MKPWMSDRYTIGSSFGASKKASRKSAGSSSRTRRKRSRSGARSIAAGDGKVNDDGKRVPLDVKAGDLILFGKYTSQEVKLDGEEYLIMREDEVLAVIDGGATKTEVASALS